jgi:hypothetical protein
MGDEASDEVLLLWRSSVATASTAAGAPIPLPSLEQSRVPTLVAIHAPQTTSVASSDGGLQPLSRDRLEMARAEWLERTTIEGLTRIDRGSLRDREALVAALARFELLLRDADRAAASALNRTPSARAEWIERIRKRSATARLELVEAIETAGLDEFLRSARVHVGLARPEATKPPLETPELTSPVRVRRFGHPHGFQGETAPTGKVPTLVWRSAKSPGTLEREGRWELLLAAIGAPFATWGLVVWGGRPGRPHAVAGAFVLAAAAIFGGPVVLATALLLAALGRYS